MKRAVSLLLLIALLGTGLIGCGEIPPSFAERTENSDTGDLPTSESDAIVSNTDVSDETEIIEQTAYYQITERGGLYYYTICDKSGNIVRSEGDLPKQPHITLVDSSLIWVMTQAGTGIATQCSYYYDIDNNLFSQIYQGVLDQCDRLVVYATYEKVIIRDIFDDNGFYQELSVFREGFSEVAYPFVRAELDEDCSSICVTYLTGAAYEEVSEVFDLTMAG